MRRIAVIGTGYVGLVTGACLAELGNSVVCLDRNAPKIQALRRGVIPIHEPGLSELVVRNQQAGRLAFTDDIAPALRDSEIIFITVGTPTSDAGNTELGHVREAAQDIALALNGPKLVVNKSTVPVETGDFVSSIIRERNGHGHHVSIVANPEFLREGSAIVDFMNPDRIVLGVSDPDAEAAMRDLYSPLNAPIIVTDVRAAEMIKYAANAFLATRISFINEIAKICERVDVDVKDVVAGLGADHRIGATYLNPGLGFGGSCLPKDVLGLCADAKRHGLELQLLSAVLEVNRSQIDQALALVTAALGSIAKKRIALLGLAFKPNTDDVRESPAIALASRLLAGGAIVQAHDPVANRAAAELLKGDITFFETCYQATNDAEAVIVATDWNEYKQLDFSMLRKLMAGRHLIDTRGLYEPAKVTAEGLVLLGIGRPSPLERATASSPSMKAAQPPR